MRRSVVTTVVAVTGACTALVGAAAASATPSQPGNRPTGGYTAQVILSGSSLTHEVGGSLQPLTAPDDIVALRGKLFVGFQNGVGPQGEPTSSGNSASTLVEMARDGDVAHQWDLTGKIDGLGADKAAGLIAATVNEDGNSSLYIINPSSHGPGAVTHYVYSPNPLPHGGGTDAVTFMSGLMLIGASAPTQNGPAVYSVTLQPPTTAGGDGVASATSLFMDNATATPANAGAPSQLALTDPDSNTKVPGSAPRFGGDFMLDSQGDLQQIYVSDPGTSHQALSVLQLTQSVNDTSFVTSDDGLLFVTDASSDSVDAVTGPFHVGEAFVSATPCGSNNAPSTCPAPPQFPANFLGTLDLNTGSVNQVPVSGVSLTPQGTVFVGGGENRKGRDQGGNGDDE